MIYITGDMHGDMSRLKNLALTEKDTLIVTGDFGLLWDNSYKLIEKVNILKSVPYTILFVDGNHENFDMLKNFSIERWQGGEVQHIIRNKVIRLCRGQVFNIEDYTFFVMGGAESTDARFIIDRNNPEDRQRETTLKLSGIFYRVKNVDWWFDELPSEQDYVNARYNLIMKNWNVDYVISHCASNRMINNLGLKGNNKLTDFLNELEVNLSFRHWYFGHYHRDTIIDDKHTCIYKKIIPLDI